MFLFCKNFRIKISKSVHLENIKIFFIYKLNDSKNVTAPPCRCNSQLRNAYLENTLVWIRSQILNINTVKESNIQKLHIKNREIARRNFLR